MPFAEPVLEYLVLAWIFQTFIGFEVVYMLSEFSKYSSFVLCKIMFILQKYTTSIEENVYKGRDTLPLASLLLSHYTCITKKDRILKKINF